MATDNYLTFQEFENREDAEKIALVLEENHIPCSIEKTPDLLDNVIIGRQYNNYVQLRIPAGCFADAQKILIENTKVDLVNVDRNYMLFALTNEELMDVIAKPDHWGAYNYNLAKLILEERNMHIDNRKVDEIQLEYKKEMYEPRSLNTTWLLLGYGFSILSLIAVLTNNIRALLFVYGFDLLPGVLGIILGLYVINTKRTLPDGSQMLSFNDAARKHGWFMLVLATIAVALILARAFIKDLRFDLHTPF
jgi:hypothetical protein